MAVVEAEADELLGEVKVAMIAVAVELRLTWDRKSIRGSSSITVEIAVCIAVENSCSSRKSSSSGIHRSRLYTAEPEKRPERDTSPETIRILRPNL
jgi:hypothetical protein